MDQIRQLKINHGQRQLDWLNTVIIEHNYHAKYVGEFCLRNRDNSWSESPVAVFYQPDPDVSKGHTHYFGIFKRSDGVALITNASSAAEVDIQGIQYGDEIIYSRFRHDCRSDSTGSVFVDGGRDYLRWGGDMDHAKVVTLRIIDGELKVVG
jgi:hypothetical protein